MTPIEQGLEPEEFASTAARAISACANLNMAEQALRLAGDGLLGVIAADDIGGLDLPLSFAVPVIKAANAGLLGFPILEAVLLARCLRASTPRAAEAIVTGKMLATVAWHGGVRSESRGNDTVVLNGTVARAPCAADVGHVLVRVGESAAALVPIGTKGVSVEDASGIDLAVPEHTIELNEVILSRDCLLDDSTWIDLQSDASILRAAAILGSAETCLGLAQEHASTRRQFGRALSYNQAIRHALARQKLGLEGIRHAITRALGDQAGAREREAAFLAASAYGASICEGALQVHGGMGFTWDVSIHRHLRRIRSLQAQGNVSSVMATLGQRYIAEVAPVTESAAF